MSSPKSRPITTSPTPVMAPIEAMLDQKLAAKEGDQIAIDLHSAAETTSSLNAEARNGR